jgi:hypothetical protein
MHPANEVLQALVGLPLSIVRSAADMRVFHFGDVRPHHAGRGTVGEFALHVQCPWRLTRHGNVLTGSSDRWVPAPNALKVDTDDPRSGSLQDVRLAALLGGYDEVTKSHVNDTGGLVVESASSDLYGSADILFSDGTRLELFPDSSAEEDWRFFKPGDRVSHFVVEAGCGSWD